MNKIYNAMLKLSDNDPVSTWKSLKKSYGLNEDKVDLLMQNFVSILNEDDSIFNRIMIATLEKDNIVNELANIFKVDKLSFMHSKSNDTINMMKNMALFDALEDIYNIVKISENINEEVFVFTWSVAVSNDIFQSLFDRYKNKKKQLQVEKK